MMSWTSKKTLYYNRGGNNAACEPHAALPPILCGSEKILTLEIVNLRKLFVTAAIMAFRRRNQ